MEEEGEERGRGERGRRGNKRLHWSQNLTENLQLNCLWMYKNLRYFTCENLQRQIAHTSYCIVVVLPIIVTQL